MSRSRGERQRYLEGIVGDLGKVDVWAPGARPAPEDAWLYEIKCRTCWAEEPTNRRRGHQMPSKMTFRADSQAKVIAAWIEHEARYHASE